MYTSHTKKSNYSKRQFLNLGGGQDTFNNLREVTDSLSSALMYTNFHLITDFQEDNHGPPRKAMNFRLMNLNLKGSLITSVSGSKKKY